MVNLKLYNTQLTTILVFLDGTISSNHFLNNQFEFMKSEYDKQEQEQVQKNNNKMMNKIIKILILL